MGCVFTKRQALSFRKNRKMPKANREQDCDFEGFHKSILSKPKLPSFERPAPTGERVIPTIWENILPEYSTLAFMMGGKEFDDEEMVFPDQKAVTNPEVRSRVDHEARIDLPDCVNYKGIHEYGFHVIEIDSDKFCMSPENFRSISDDVISIIGQEKCVIVYKQIHCHTAYLPDVSSYGQDLLNSLCIRLGDQLLRLVFHKPSWFVQMSLTEEQNGTRNKIFSEAAMAKLRFTKTIVELGKLTGFPGEIKC